MISHSAVGPLAVRPPITMMRPQILSRFPLRIAGPDREHSPGGKAERTVEAVRGAQKSTVSLLLLHPTEGDVVHRILVVEIREAHVGNIVEFELN